MADLQRQAPRFRPTCIPKASTGEIALSLDDSLNVEDLRGVELEKHPQATSFLDTPDGGQDGDPAWYLPRGIRPFHLTAFTNSFAYGQASGTTPVWNMGDVLQNFGFSRTGAEWIPGYPLNRPDHSPAEGAARWLGVHGIDWFLLMSRMGISPAADGQPKYHELPSRREEAAAQVSRNLSEHLLPYRASFASVYLDVEAAHLSRSELRRRAWYPGSAGTTEKAAFERSYYDGLAMSFTLPVEAARSGGWKEIGVYGWSPGDVPYWELRNPPPDPVADDAWNTWGKSVYRAVDVLLPSLYTPYPGTGNIFYMLARSDSARRYVATMQPAKPVRPFIWLRYHGGGGGWRWWRALPVPNEEARAMGALLFLTKIDGLVVWDGAGYEGSSATQFHQFVSLPAIDAYGRPIADYSVEDDFEATSEVGLAKNFHRYDVVHFVSVDPVSRRVEFQSIDTTNLTQDANPGTGPTQPHYWMPEHALAGHLRGSSAPMAGLIEGLALIRPFEVLLRHGDVKVDQAAQPLFRREVDHERSAPPVVRRVKLGGYNLLVTYDPGAVRHPESSLRRVVLEDFDGQSGLTLTLPADAQTRVFLLKDGS